MTELELRQLADTILAPLLVADDHGTVLAENRAWVSVRQMLGAQAAELQALLLKTAECGAPQTLKVSGLTVVSSRFPSGYIMLQIKDENLQRLREKMEDTMQTNSSYQETLSNFGIQNCIATSDSMIRIFTKAKQVAAYPTTVLLLGETGVGKEVVSSFIHHNSDRADKPFIKINCSAIPEPLMESELFGYEKGAFTGAREKGKMGLFELANHGTILLDEIGDMSLSLQAKLLRTIQENEIMRVGGTVTIPVDVRLIAATNQDLESMVQRGEFRRDLYYRLNLIPLHIPPLRERVEDIPLLIHHFLEKFNAKYGKTKRLTDEAMQVMKLYPWPGNIRELENLLERLVIIGDESRITSGQVTKILGTSDPVLPAGIEESGLSLKEMVAKYEKELLQEALIHYGTTYRVAQALNTSQPTVARKAKQYGLEW